MFFNDIGKEIAAKIKSRNRDILRDIRSIHLNAVISTRTEVEYFKRYFPEFERNINSLRIPGITFSCRTHEIHGRPIVSYGGVRCELGDYFVVVKYKDKGTVVGRKMVICQHKRSHKSSWSINQNQLTILKDWPTFTFGKVATSYNTFTIKPSRPEFGSYVLINDPYKTSFPISNLFANAFEISLIQSGVNVRVSDADKFYYDSQFALTLLLTWEIGEPIVLGSDLEKFTSALYRYLDWEEDPPNEFADFEEKMEEGSFWGIEITVSVGEDSNREN